MKKQRKVKSLYSKKVKLSTKLADHQALVRKNQENAEKLRLDLESLEKEILKEELSNYHISLSDLNEVAKRYVDESKLDSFLQSVVKESDDIYSSSKFKRDEDQAMDVWTCSAEGRMNICIGEESGECPLECPIVDKVKCDGVAIRSIFIQKRKKNDT